MTIWRSFAMFFVLLALTAGGANAERIERVLDVNGQKRSYIAYVPKAFSNRHLLPILIAFHPGLANGIYMERMTGFHTHPKGRGFIIVYPDGHRRSWNAGACCGQAKAQGIDDLGFFEAIMDDLAARYSVSPKAYLTGYSNGAILAYHIACNLPKRVAAIAPHGATYSGRACVPGRFSIMHTHGRADETAPFGGGMTNVRVFDTSRLHAPVMGTVAFFAQRNGCLPNETQRRHLDTLRTDCQVYSGCEEYETMVCAIEGLGHYWPGAEAARHLLAPRFGPARNDLDGTGAILNFFSSHRENQDI